jgi:DNA-binding NtrC family response regulator
MSATEHILIVDDEVNIRATLRALLERSGYQVAVAAGGHEAFALLDEHDFDLMMVDLKMPGIDGMQVVERARERRPEMVVIVLTGHGSLDSAIAGMRHGIFDYLLKTTEPAQVIERVRAGLLTRARELRRRTLIQTLDAAAPPHRPNAPSCWAACSSTPGTSRPCCMARRWR